MKNYLEKEFDLKQLVEVYDELPLWAAPFGLKLLDKINYRKNITALDIGFGTGFPFTELCMRLGPTCTVNGIDPWKDAIERVKRKIGYYGITNCALIEGVAESMPLENNTVDLIVSNNGLNNVNDLVKSLAECYRVSKPGAQVVQTMNLERSMHEFYDELEKVLDGHGMKNEIEKMYAHIYSKRKPIAEVRIEMEKAGFTIISIDEHEFAYRFADATALFNHYFMQMAFMGSWKALLPQGKVHSIFSEVEERLNTLAAKQGFLTLTIPFVVIEARRN